MKTLSELLKPENFIKNNIDKFNEDDLIKLVCKYNNIMDIPENLITEKIVNKYFEVHCKLEHIPEKYITKEMVDIYWNKNINNHEYSIVGIPEKYITQEMVDKYYRRNKDLSYIPISMITDDILFDYYDTYKTLNYISYDIDVPKELLYKIHQDHDNPYIIYHLPLKYVTNEMIINYIKTYSASKLLPHFLYKLSNKELIEACNDKLYTIDDRRKDQSFYNDYFEITGKITRIPKEYITQEMVDKISIDDYWYKVPERFVTEEIRSKLIEDLLK